MANHRGAYALASVRRIRLGIGGVAALAAASAAAERGVPNWDRRLFRRLNALPDAWAPVVWVPMQAGALAAPIAVAVWLAAARSRPRDGARVAAAGMSAWAAAKVIKRVVHRGRPGDHETDTVLRLGSAAHGLGYPSGHAAVAATLAWCLAPDPATVRGLGALALAGAVGGARIYVGAHYPLDVLGGWALGAAVAAVTGPITGASAAG